MSYMSIFEGLVSLNFVLRPSYSKGVRRFGDL